MTSPFFLILKPHELTKSIEASIETWNSSRCLSEIFVKFNQQFLYDRTGPGTGPKTWFAIFSTTSFGEHITEFSDFIVHPLKIVLLDYYGE
jgi:hypothetical protein